MFSKTLICLSADVWGCVPSLLVVWPEVTQHWSLQAKASGRAYTNKYIPDLLLPLLLAPQWAIFTHTHTHPSASSEYAPALAGRFGSVSYVSLLLSSGLHKTLCVLFKIGVSVSPSLIEGLQSNPTGLQSRILWGFLLLLPDIQDEKPDVGLRMFTPGRTSVV